MPHGQLDTLRHCHSRPIEHEAMFEHRRRRVAVHRCALEADVAGGRRGGGRQQRYFHVRIDGGAIGTLQIRATENCAVE